MRRREFITLIGGAAVARPLATLAQTAGKPPTVAYLSGTALVEGDWVDGLVRRLSELGWVEGRTVVIERRWSESRPERVAEIAAEYVQQKVDVIVTYGAAVVTLSTVVNTRVFTTAGALMSYGPNVAALYQRAADYVDKILRGANPGELPVEQPTRFELVINLKSAKALGIEVPSSMQLLADEVIE